MTQHGISVGHLCAECVMQAWDFGACKHFAQAAEADKARNKLGTAHRAVSKFVEAQVYDPVNIPVCQLQHQLLELPLSKTAAVSHKELKAFFCVLSSRFGRQHIVT